MTVTKVEFNFNGSESIFHQKLDEYLSSTEEGKRYKKKDTLLEDTLQSGRIVLTIDYTKETSDVLRVVVVGYVKNSNLIWLLLLPIMCWCGYGLKLKGHKPLIPDSIGLQKRGWNDLVNLLEYLEVEDYQVREKGLSEI